MKQQEGLRLKMKIRLWTLVGLSLVGSLFMSACGSKGADATPTLSVEMIQTQAVATFAAGQTQTALAMPTETPTPTDTPTPTPTSTPALTNAPGIPTAPGGGIPPTSSCYSMAFVADVTIPDNTTMTPGQKFTKTWRVRNNGSCAWEAGYKLNFTSGNAMDGSAVTLEEALDPGKEVELSVSLTAPSSSGTHRGNWRMSNAGGTYFGDEVYVLIGVSGSVTTTPTVKASATPSATSTATLTATPTVTEPPTEAEGP